MTSVLSSKCQVTIPKKVRDRLGLKPGSRFEWVSEGDNFFLKPVDQGLVEKTAGALSRYAKNRRGRSDETILREAAQKLIHGRIHR
jgi:AbrB family looped-hinge helix DNA binding protein